MAKKLKTKARKNGKDYQPTRDPLFWSIVAVVACMSVFGLIVTLTDSRTPEENATIFASQVLIINAGVDNCTPHFIRSSEGLEGEQDSVYEATFAVECRMGNFAERNPEISVSCKGDLCRLKDPLQR